MPIATAVSNIKAEESRYYKAVQFKRQAERFGYGAYESYGWKSRSTPSESKCSIAVKTYRPRPTREHFYARAFAGKATTLYQKSNILRRWPPTPAVYPYKVRWRVETNPRLKILVKWQIIPLHTLCGNSWIGFDKVTLFGCSFDIEKRPSKKSKET